MQHMPYTLWLREFRMQPDCANDVNESVELRHGKAQNARTSARNSGTPEHPHAPIFEPQAAIE
jgi:hypothetical protein